MPTVKNGTVLYVAHPDKHIDPNVHLKYVEREIDLENVPLNGGVLLKTLYVSSDPYVRYRMRDPSIETFCPPIHLGDPVDNFGVGVVLRSEDPKFKPGDHVSGFSEFSEYSVYPGQISHSWKAPLRKIQKLSGGHSISAYAGTLGMPGSTAYQGIRGFASEKLKTAKTMFISGGAGPVGTFVTEYTKAIAPHVKIIASAGSADKVKIMKSAGVDVAFNYKEEDTFAILKEHGPIDIYWDNVAGPTLDAALLNFNNEGLIIACGAISQANHDESSVVRHFEEMFQRSLTVKGLIVYTGPSSAVLSQFYDEIVPLVEQGKISIREHRYNGLQEAGKALADVHSGGNTGKAVIVVAEE